MSPLDILEVIKITLILVVSYIMFLALKEEYGTDIIDFINKFVNNISTLEYAFITLGILTFVLIYFIIKLIKQNDALNTVRETEGVE